MMKSTQLADYANKPADFLEAFWTLPTGIAPKLYDYQREFLEYPYKEGPRRLEIVNKSRQTGFSTVCITGRIFHEIYFGLAPFTMMVSASERQAITLLEHIKNGIDALPQQLQPQLVKDKESHIRLKNGCNVESVPQSDSSVRGFNGNIILDEQAFQPKDKAIWTALMPSMRGGNRITCVSTPMGKKNQFYLNWVADQEAGYDQLPIEKQWKKFKVMWNQCPDLVPDIDMWKAGLTEDEFRQEYCCEFIDETTAFFPYDLITKCVDSELTNTEGYVGPNRITFGIDLARKHDETVIVVTEHMEDGTKRVIALYALTKQEYSKQYNYIMRLIDAFNPDKVYVDATGQGIPMGDALQAEIGLRCVPITFNNFLKEKMVTDLKILMEDDRIKIPDDAMLRAQLHGLEQTTTAAGNNTYAHSYGNHDDRVWALCLSVYNDRPVRKFGGSFFTVSL